MEARREIRLFDLVRTAVNGDEKQAREFFEGLRSRAYPTGSRTEEPQIVIASEEDAAAFLRSIGR